MQPLSFAVLGAGFWANYQVAAWHELGGIELRAVCDPNRDRADALARRFNVPNVYTDATELLHRHADELDFVDIITNVQTHAPLVAAVAERGLDVICQKPMAPDLAIAQQMLATCERAGVRLFVHENFRWQTPIRALKGVLDSGVIGKPFGAEVSFCSAFPVFDNQPALADLEQFILTDIGTHILDVCRFLFGEAESLYAQTQRVNPGIRGEDVAKVMLRMRSGLTCFADMSYASLREREAFPQTLIRVDGAAGSVALTYDYGLTITTRAGTETRTTPPPAYPWADPAYALVHASIVDCNRDLLAALRGERGAETTGRDNVETLRLVYAAYDSAARNQVVPLTPTGP